MYTSMWVRWQWIHSIIPLGRGFIYFGIRSLFVLNVMEKVKIKRQWNDWRIAQAEFSKLSDFHWSRESGGVRAPAPQYFIHAYVWCDEYDGDLAHSCQHGSAPHSIKVCITKADNDPTTFAKIKAQVGDKPVYRKLRKRLKLNRP
jgi:hypothetical protein